MDDKQQRSFIHFLSRRLKETTRELMAYQLLAHLLRDAGVVGVEEILEKARNSPALQAKFDKNFEGFDELLPPPDPSYEDQVKELLEKWKPRGGLPN